MLLLSAVGAFVDLETTVDRVKFKLRGTVEPTQAVSVVTFDKAFQEKRSIPYDAADLFEVVERIAQDAPTMVIVSLHPGIIAGPSREIKCHTRAYFYGPTRPDWLPPDCRFSTARNAQESLAIFKSRFAAADHETQNWSGAIPTISATHLLDKTFLPGAFDEHNVVLDTVPQEFATKTPTPFGEISGQMLFAEQLSARLDGRAMRRSWPLDLALLVVALLFGVYAPRLRFPKVAYAVSGGAISAAAMVAFSYGLDLWLIVPQLVLGSIFLTRRFVPERYERSEREAQSRLKSAIAISAKRRPQSLSAEEAFWDLLMERASREFESSELSLAELKPGDWWIAFRGFSNMDEGGIKERRRDVRRAPYDKPFSDHKISTSKGYHVSDQLKTIFVPLVHDEACVGFWMIHAANPEQTLERDGRKIRRIASQLAYEIHLHQLDVASPNVLQTRKLDPDQLARTALATIDQIETDRRTLDRLIENTDIGMMIVDQFGDVVYENASMSKILTVDAEHSRFQDILEAITDDPIEGIAEGLERAFETGESFEAALSLNTELPRVVSFRFFPIKHERDSRQPIYHISVSAFDVTKFVGVADDRTALSNTVADRARDALQVSKAYISSIPKSSTGVNIAAGLESVMKDVGRIVNDFQTLADPSFSDSADALFSLQSAVKNAILGAEKNEALPTVQTQLPSEVVVARGASGAIEKAIQLLITDALALSSESPNLQISISEEGREVVVRVMVDNSTIPNAMLQRLLEMNEDAERHDQRLAVAKEFIQSNRGKLEASSSEEGQLSFTIRLPRGDHS